MSFRNTSTFMTEIHVVLSEKSRRQKWFFHSISFLQFALPFIQRGGEFHNFLKWGAEHFHRNHLQGLCNVYSPAQN